MADEPKKNQFDVYAHIGLLFGAFSAMRPGPEYSIVIGAIAFFLSLSYLIWNCQWEWLKNGRLVKGFWVLLALALTLSMVHSSWPRKEIPEIVLKIEPVSLPVFRENDRIYSLEVMGRFQNNVGMGYGPADKLSKFWPQENMEHHEEAFRYTLINRGKSILYNLLLDFKITHEEALQTESGFSQGKEVHSHVSIVKVDELVPYGLTSNDGNFVFYARNLSEDFVYVEPPEFLTLDGKQKIKIRKIGAIYPLAPPKVWKGQIEKKDI